MGFPPKEFRRISTKLHKSEFNSLEFYGTQRINGTLVKSKVLQRKAVKFLRFAPAEAISVPGGSMTRWLGGFLVRSLRFQVARWVGIGRLW